MSKRYQLRPYQQEAVDNAMEFMRKCLSPQLLILPTGAGKSLIVAELAHRIYTASKKKILCIAPSKELILQNHEKYLLTGEPASIYSASAGRKEMKHPVVFASPQTLVNALDKLSNDFAAIVIDEAHGLTPTLMKIIERLQSLNSKIRVVGMTATAFRLGTGYIYADHYEKGPTTEDNAIDPYFARVTYDLPARYLIDNGYLTPPTTEISETHYNTAGLELNRMGKFNASDIDKAFNGQGRKTASIVADVVAKSANRVGVMIFGATIQHCTEIMESLPPELSAMVTGETKHKERAKIIDDFKNKKIKYLVNCAVLTTGFDASHVDVIALMRATESAMLLTQIIGRGLRLDDDKTDCLILDYAENIERHFPDGDLFSPEIKAKRKGESVPINCLCEWCGYQNEFSARENPDSLEIDANGYFTDLAGERIMVEAGAKNDTLGNCETIYKPMPAHWGRRCTGMHINRLTHQWERCGYQWSSKECPECGHHNDIAARYCTSCKTEIVDPNTKLKEEAAKLAKDPYATQMAKVESMMISKNYGVNGRPDTLKVEFFIEEKPHKLTAWYAPNSEHSFAQRQYKRFSEGSYGAVVSLDNALDLRTAARTPSMIAFRKKQDSKYYEVSNVFYEV